MAEGSDLSLGESIRVKGLRGKVMRHAAAHLLPYL